jgi:hypothetical protein
VEIGPICKKCPMMLYKVKSDFRTLGSTLRLYSSKSISVYPPPPPRAWIRANDAIRAVSGRITLQGKRSSPRMRPGAGRRTPLALRPVQISSPELAACRSGATCLGALPHRSNLP